MCDLRTPASARMGAGNEYLLAKISRSTVIKHFNAHNYTINPAIVLSYSYAKYSTESLSFEPLLAMDDYCYCNSILLPQNTVLGLKLLLLILIT